MESAKKLALTAALSQYNKVLVAFSGGIDSTVVLDAALKTLGKENVLAVVANSDLFTDEEYTKAMDLAQEMGATVLGTTLDYLANDDIKNNRASSWYWMKKMFYQKMNELKDNSNCDVVLDGMIMDDKTIFVPAYVPVTKRVLFQCSKWLTSTSQTFVTWPVKPVCQTGTRLPAVPYHHGSNTTLN